ncbi:MAG: hypothetical protein JOY60_11305 [Burkholderiaceae bacterium]|nr:hypothetical protein [Roseateles sp.]MBV8470429.1 hypothetical protein [Burkholderiaceae bacterium]
MNAIVTMKRTALIAAGLVLLMIAVFVATGIGQDALQAFKPPEQYTQTLLRDPATLRGVIGVDNAFILFYGTCFLLLGRELMNVGSNRALAMAGTALLMTTAVLDMVENLHFLSMIAMAQSSLAISAGEIALQVWESLLKFHASYLGLFLLGLVMPARTPALRLLAASLVYVQWPVGMLIYVGPESWTKPLIFVRLAFFLVGLLIIALTDWQKIVGSGARA